MRNRRFAGLVLAATFAAGALTALGSGTPASAAPSGAAAELFDLMNAERTAAGLPTLSWRGDVAAIALDWSTAMSGSGNLAHNDEYFSDSVRQHLGARNRGENVAVAGTIPRAHTTLMNSPPHRAAILDPTYTEAGFAAVQDGSGRWWVTQNFMRPYASQSSAPVPSPAEEPEPTPVVEEQAAPVVTALPTTTPPTTTPTTTPPPPPPPPTTAAPEPATVAMSLPDSPAVEWVAPKVAVASSSPATLDRTDPAATHPPALGLVALAAALLTLTASLHVVHRRHRA